MANLYRTKKNREKRSRRTLEDDRKSNEEVFNEKIKVLNSGYICTKCNYATGVMLEAKVHALSCKVRQKKNVKRKVVNCNHCDKSIPLY